MIWNVLIEKANREEIKKIQSDGLVKMINRIYNNVPFYRKKFQDRGIEPKDITDVNQLKELPFTVKDDLRQNYPFGLFTVPQEKIVRLHASSGTTGSSSSGPSETGPTTSGPSETGPPSSESTTSGSSPSSGSSSSQGSTTTSIVCDDVLGMESGAIPDSALSASTEYSDRHGAHRGRLNMVDEGAAGVGGWSPLKSDLNPYYQVGVLKSCKNTN